MNFNSVDWTTNLGLIFLSYEVFQTGVDNIPPVTIATLVLNIFVYLSPVKPVTQVCVSVQTAVWQREWRRMLLGPFHHRNDWHLSLNMVSLLRAKPLEHFLGGVWFACLLAIFSLLTGLVYLLLRAGLYVLTEDSSHGSWCIVGFDAVLIGLHVVNVYYHPNSLSQLMGFPVATRVTCWMELFLVYALEPGVSVLTPLSGLLVGLLYTKGPLRSAMAGCAGVMTGNQTGRRSMYFYESGYSGWRSPNPTADLNHPQFSRKQAPATHSSETRCPDRPPRANSSPHTPSRKQRCTGRPPARDALNPYVQLHDLHPRTTRQLTKGASCKYVFTCPCCPRTFCLRIARNRHLLTHGDQPQHESSSRPHRQVNQSVDDGPPDPDPVMVPQSPDLNPSENLWNMVKKKLGSYMASNQSERLIQGPTNSAKSAASARPSNPVTEEVRHRRLLRFQHLTSEPAAAFPADC
ncbi:rhomboid-related protein 4-like [Alosa sapidissima]|uniref:rhomboid-related protein 4-like n=1 Tax=Alosa sapidissima TaxID=34773 RepID=UPI001C086422|nr:rhomboid-related protein 4-like [Alosa sapidissima]